jgi:ribonuclease I
MSPDDLKIIIDKIKASIVSDKAKSVKTTNTQNFSMNEVKTYFQRKYPQETNDQIKVRVLDFMKDQFFCSFPEDNMSVSSKGSKDIDEDEDVLAGESQPDPTMEDIWDSMIEIVASKAK